MKKITNKDLMRYFRGETTRLERNQIREAIRKDLSLKQAYFVLVNLHTPQRGTTNLPPKKIIDELVRYGVKKNNEIKN